MEDVDRPRMVPGSADAMLRTLRRFGFEWDGEVAYQGDRTAHYADALETLRTRGLTFECSCSRTQLAEEDRYPGHCRASPLLGEAPTSVRLRVEPGYVQFTDRIQGTFRQDVAAAVGDIVLRRKDRLFAYVTAVVVDDAAHGVTHIVRGADLLDNTPRQIYLQRLLGLPLPRYAHVPLLTEPDGKKLAKSARSVALNTVAPMTQLLEVFALLGLPPAPGMKGADAAEIWQWAIAQWNIAGVPKRLSLTLGA